MVDLTISRIERDLELRGLDDPSERRAVAEYIFQELAAAYAVGHDQGYHDGYAYGYKVGYEAGYDEVSILLSR
ncbi:MAG: hypothetical protein MN733_17425 [Nitrososphaera sp.]|nr:hypothetical protein [Nitrososphaera sp.]